jgi:hypothetical protein
MRGDRKLHQLGVRFPYGGFDYWPDRVASCQVQRGENREHLGAGMTLPSGVPTTPDC